MKRRLVLAVVAAGSLGGGVVGAVPALAGSAMRTPSRRSLINKTSTGFAGWRFRATRKTASVTTQFVVPSRVNCAHAKHEESAAPGAYVVTDPAKHTGDAGVVELLCINQTYVALSAAEVANTAYFGKTASPGDLVKTTVVDGKHSAMVIVRDLTKGHRFTFTKSTAAAAPASVTVGLYQQTSLSKPHRPFLLPDFGTLRFRAAQVNGRPLGSLNGQPYNWVTRKNHVRRVRTGALTGGGSPAAHNAFTVTWRHA
jgi:hypothetical protein